MSDYKTLRLRPLNITSVERTALIRILKHIITFEDGIWDETDSMPWTMTAIAGDELLKNLLDKLENVKNRPNPKKDNQ